MHGPVFEKSLDKIYAGIITRRLKLQEQKPNVKHIRGDKIPLERRREERKGTTPVRRFDGEESRQAAHPDPVKSLCNLETVAIISFSASNITPNKNVCHEAPSPPPCLHLTPTGV